MRNALDLQDPPINQEFLNMFKVVFQCKRIFFPRDKSEPNSYSISTKCLWMLVMLVAKLLIAQTKLPPFR